MATVPVKTSSTLGHSFRLLPAVGRRSPGRRWLGTNTGEATTGTTAGCGAPGETGETGNRNGGRGWRRSSSVIHTNVVLVTR